MAALSRGQCRGHGGTGIFWKAPFQAFEDAGIEAILDPARFVEQTRGGKSDVAGSLRLARICQPGHVPPREFRQLRQSCRYRR